MAQPLGNVIDLDGDNVAAAYRTGVIDPKRSWNRLAAETTIARVDLSTDSGSIGPGR